MRIIVQLLLIACLLAACATGDHVEKKTLIGEARCVLRSCRQFSSKVPGLGRAAEFVGVTFEIIDPKEYRGKSVALFAGYDAEHGQDLLLVPLGSEFSVDLSRADVVMLPDGSLKARAPYSFTYK